VAKSDTKPFRGTGRARPAYVDARPSGPALFAAALVACFALSALLTLEILPGPVGGLAVGMPEVGDIADHDEKAPFALTIPDPPATERLRREATDGAPAVYDFDDKRRPRCATDRPPSPARAVPPPPVDAGPRWPTALAWPFDAESPEWKLVRVESRCDAPTLIAHLEKSRFSTDDERLLEQLVEGAAGRMVIDDAAEFDRQAVSRTVVVRDLVSGNERALKPNAHVLSTESARALVEKNAAELLTSASPAARAALTPLARALVRPNLSFNLRATDERRKAAEASVKEATISLRKGEIIVRDGDPISERHVLILKGIREQQSALSRAAVFVGVALLLFAVMRVVWRFGATSLQRFPRRSRDAWFLLTVLVGTSLGTSLALFVTDMTGESPRLQSLVDEWPGCCSS
jgi:hypothetical protein